MVLSELREARDSEAVGRKILESMTRPFAVSGHEIEISCSIGISTYPADGADIVTLLAHADVAMYHAKKRGRNNFQLFTLEMKPAT